MREMAGFELEKTPCNAANGAGSNGKDKIIHYLSKM
jgi:hypothetical protein